MTKTKALIAGLVLVVLATTPLWAPEYLVMVLMLIFLYMALAQLWNLLAGYAGLVSLGQQIFIGLGGYSLAVSTELFELPVWVGMVLGGLFSVVFAALMSVPIFRTKGVFFTIGTWIVAEALLVTFSNWEYVRYAQGFFITAGYDFTAVDLYYISLALALVALIVVFTLMRSKLGLGLMAMRDNEPAAEAMGLFVFKTKLMCFLIAAFLTGVTGAALYLNLGTIQPNGGFGINWTVAMVFMVIIGGIGTIEGPIVGAVIYVLLQQWLYNYPGISMIILGAIAIVVILVAPRGVMGTLKERLGVEFFALRRT